MLANIGKNRSVPIILLGFLGTFLLCIFLITSNFLFSPARIILLKTTSIWSNKIQDRGRSLIFIFWIPLSFPPKKYRCRLTSSFIRGDRKIRSLSLVTGDLRVPLFYLRQNTIPIFPISFQISFCIL